MAGTVFQEKEHEARAWAGSVIQRWWLRGRRDEEEEGIEAGVLATGWAARSSIAHK